MSVRLRLLHFQALTLLAVAAPPLAAQYSQHVRWPLVDVLVRGDTLGSLEILASPNLSSKQGTASDTRLSRIVVNPTEATQWATLMGRLVDSVAALRRSTDSMVFRPALFGPNRGDTLVVGATAQSGKKRFRFMVTHKDSSRAWHVAVTGDELRDFLAALAEIGDAARASEGRKGFLKFADRQPWCPIDTTSVSDDGDFDTRPVPLSTRLEYPIADLRMGRQGRVWLQFIIDTTGFIAPGSACVLFADAGGFAGAVLKAAPRFRFQPGIIDGQSVACLALQEYRFTIRSGGPGGSQTGTEWDRP